MRDLGFLLNMAFWGYSKLSFIQTNLDMIPIFPNLHFIWPSQTYVNVPLIGVSQMNPSRKRNRLQNYDYSQMGYYFVTICTYNRIRWFGEVIDGEMHLNENGEIIQQQWEWRSDQYRYITNDCYVVMPNHVHGIIGIGAVAGNSRDCSLQDTPKIKSLSSLIGAFKTTSSKMIHLSGQVKFKWQKSFHDHIIRNYGSFERIREYIMKNPSAWHRGRKNSRNAQIHSYRQILCIKKGRLV